jgi:diaminohydroxyphosphoribosylaminopyrimidine deaminase/5-amino-6-(5-phosphoribosylamino)uracil reductase
VIVHDGNILGEGWHRQFGMPHAEVNAINDVPPEKKALLKKSVLYVNLEPCSHTGKTPPCSDLIIRHGIPHVVIAQTDPNPLVAGKGIQKLREAGIQVTTGVLRQEALDLNRSFNYHIINRKPYVLLKWANSADGFLGQPDKQVWLSNAYSRRLSHKWRQECDAILVGTTTALVDNPALDNRFYFGKSPVRVVIDRQLVLPHDLRIFQSAGKTFIITEKNKRPLESERISYICLPFGKKLIPDLLEELYKKNIGLLLVEGGAFTLNEFIRQDQYQEIRVFQTTGRLDKGIISPAISLPPDIIKQVDTDELKVWLKEKG